MQDVNLSLLVQRQDILGALISNYRIGGDMITLTCIADSFGITSEFTGTIAAITPLILLSDKGIEHEHN